MSLRGRNFTDEQYGPGVYRLSIDLVGRGLVDLKPLITHTYVFSPVLHLVCLAADNSYPFEKCREAFDTTKNGKSPDGKLAIKVVSKSLPAHLPPDLHLQCSRGSSPVVVTPCIQSSQQVCMLSISSFGYRQTISIR